jgi:hypothetical protein
LRGFLPRLARKAPIPRQASAGSSGFYPQTARQAATPQPDLQAPMVQRDPQVDTPQLGRQAPTPQPVRQASMPLPVCLDFTPCWFVQRPCLGRPVRLAQVDGGTPLRRGYCHACYCSLSLAFEGARLPSITHSCHHQYAHLPFPVTRISVLLDSITCLLPPLYLSVPHLCSPLLH